MLKRCLQVCSSDAGIASKKKKEKVNNEKKKQKKVQWANDPGDVYDMTSLFPRHPSCSHFHHRCSVVQLVAKKKINGKNGTKKKEHDDQETL